MSESDFKPTVYLLQGCPFCFKFMLFLEEGGLLDKLNVKTFAGQSDEESRIREKLAHHLEKITFPVAEIATSQYMADSDALIAHFEPASVKPASEMRLLKYYLDGLFPRVGSLFRENMQLKAAAGK